MEIKSCRVKVVMPPPQCHVEHLASSESDVDGELEDLGTSVGIGRELKGFSLTISRTSFRIMYQLSPL